MPYVTLHVRDASTGVALVPAAIESLGGGSKLDDEIAGEILRLGLPTLLAPKADLCAFICAHDDPGVRAADEGASADGIG